MKTSEIPSAISKMRNLDTRNRKLTREIWLSERADPQRNTPFRVGGPNKRRPGLKSRLDSLPKKSEKAAILALGIWITEFFTAQIQKNDFYPRISREEAATKTGCSLAQATRLFAKLNQRGLLTQAERSYAHDTNRNGFFHGSASGWGPNVYRPTPKAKAIPTLIAEASQEIAETL